MLPKRRIYKYRRSFCFSNLTINIGPHAIRLIEAIDVFGNQTLPGSKSLTLISKWGCDGSSGHSQYKQKFQKQGITDEYLFLISFVSLKLVSNDENQTIIWQNPKPSSTRYCRPIKFIFEKESQALAKRECENIQSQINNLVPTSVKDFNIQHKLLLTMIDGKMCNILTDTIGSQICYICGAKPTEMNTLITKKLDSKKYYEYGLSLCMDKNL